VIPHPQRLLPFRILHVACLPAVLLLLRQNPQHFAGLCYINFSFPA